jgi:hypothetical protein
MTKDILKILTARYVGTYNGSAHTLKKNILRKPLINLKSGKLNFMN